jgi:hypothetical protein
VLGNGPHANAAQSVARKVPLGYQKQLMEFEIRDPVAMLVAHEHRYAAVAAGQQEEPSKVLLGLGLTQLAHGVFLR